MANEPSSMDSILSDEKPAEAPKEELKIPVLGETTAEPDAKEAAEEQRKAGYMSKRQQARNKEAIAQGKVLDKDTGQFVAPKEPASDDPAKPDAKAAEPAKPAAAPQQEFTDKEKAFLRAAQEERTKRQQLERQLAEFQAKQPKEPEKTFWDDPEGALAKHTAQVRAEATNARLGMAEFTARQRHTDFDEKVAVFAQILQQTPGLHQQWLSSPDPAEYAYSIGKNHMELKEVGGIEELRAKIERDTATRVRAEVEAELRAKADQLAKDRAALPPSLSDARSTGGAAQRTVFHGPTPMDEILK